MPPVELTGALAARGDVPLGDRCPVDRALSVMGNRTAILLLREVFYGQTRFEPLARRVGVTEAVAARWLRDLVAADVLTKVPYREPGQRTRDGYALTPAGHDLMPVLLALLEWGTAHTPADPVGELRVHHRDCGAPVTVAVRCTAGHDVGEDEIVLTGSRRPVDQAPVQGLVDEARGPDPS